MTFDAEPRQEQPNHRFQYQAASRALQGRIKGAPTFCGVPGQPVEQSEIRARLDRARIG